MRRACLSRAPRRMLALAAGGAIAVAATPVEASNTIDIRARSTDGAGDTISPDGKSVTVNALGTKITFDIYSVITGANSVQQTGEFGGNPSDGLPDRRNDDAHRRFAGSFQSVGGLLGNMTASRTSPFDSIGSSDGLQSDLDGDGDLDIGNTDGFPEGKFLARAGAAVYSTEIDAGTAPNTPPGSRIIDAMTSEAIAGSLEWTITASSGSAEIRFIPFLSESSVVPGWVEDGIDKNHMTGTFLAGAPVTVTLVPEPAALGLMSAAALAFVPRRRSSP